MNHSDRYTSVVLRESVDDFGRDVQRALTAPQKWLPCKYFYDDTGMHLFEQICELPEYYLTRVETAILREHAAELVARCPAERALVELGPGSSNKTRYLIEPCLAQQSELEYYAIDISPAALAMGSAQLLREYPRLRVWGLAGEFADGLRFLSDRAGPARLIAFLGSTIGNLDERELENFLKMVRNSLRPDDRFLLGFDLIKDAAVLEAAYDDSQGVTARFNLNVLARMNRELGANFDLSAFRHRAIFNAERRRIEMHLVSLRDQRVHIRHLNLDVTFDRDEMIHTENCYKHSQSAMSAHFAAHGYEVIGTRTDSAERFCVLLAAPN